MFFLFSLLYSLAFIVMLPFFLIKREKYAAGFWERIGILPEFKRDERPVILLHCVSVGETNAARPLVDELISRFPEHRLVISTTTKTGQTLARDIFKAMRSVRALRAGIVWVNHMQPTYVEAPWGGYKQSGFGRELGPWGVEEYLETKQVYINLNEAPIGWY